MEGQTALPRSCTALTIDSCRATPPIEMKVNTPFHRLAFLEIVKPFSKTALKCMQRCALLYTDLSGHNKN